jgi:hypothetical protein
MNSRRISRTISTIALVAVAVAASHPVFAQGNGHAYGQSKSRAGSAAGQASAAGAPQLQVSGTGTRSFGSWLDDASIIPRGHGTMSVAFSYWRTPAYREFDLPVMDGGVGLAPRVQFNFSVPYYHASDPNGTVVRGLGDLYLSTKVQLKDPSAGGRKVGFAVTPLVEILSYPPLPDASRVSWAIPGSIEVQGNRWRTYGSAGYFSRGALFASGALEVAMGSRAWVTGSISRSHSIKRDDLSFALGLQQSRTDLGGALAVGITPTVSTFAAFGRTISRQDANSATFSLTSGIAFVFDARQH